jgi:hypothetical protein
MTIRLLSIFSACALCVGSSLAQAAPQIAVGPQYDTTHVYVAAQDFERFVKSFVATFGGMTSSEIIANVTPTPSTTKSQVIRTSIGVLSVFGYVTPIPAPFGMERNGFLVADFDKAVAAARAAGAGLIVAPFEDAIGRDAVIQWPGGVNMQLYWHTRPPPHLPALTSVPENRVYVAPEQADAFISAYLAFSQGKVLADNPKAPGVEVGEPFKTFRRVEIESGFGKTLVLATDGQLPYPWGRESTGYEVADVDATILKAEAAGVFVVVEPFNVSGRRTAIFAFPGGYIAEVHSPPKL